MNISEKITRAKQDYDDVYEAGKKNGTDEFWDFYQQNGNRDDYRYAFAGIGWTKDLFKPKYNIAPASAYGMFMYSEISGDLTEMLASLGVELDTSQLTGSANYMFQNSKFTRIPAIDVRNAEGIAQLFAYNSFLIAIDKFIVGENNVFNLTFTGLPNLTAVAFEGTIGQNGLDLRQASRLDKKSITSIINCLSTATTGCTVTLSLAAVNKAFETSVGANDGSKSDEWANLMVEKLNWTIALV